MFTRKFKWRLVTPCLCLAVVATIMELGNQILANMGVEEPVDDYSVFFT